MAEKEPIVFLCEDSLWQMLASGEKPFDMRRWDLNDDRINRLARSYWEKSEGVLASWWPDQPFVCFLNKATGEVLKFRYKGMKFAYWAPGFVFLILGGLVMQYKSGGETK